MDLVVPRARASTRVRWTPDPSPLPRAQADVRLHAAGVPPAAGAPPGTPRQPPVLSCTVVFRSAASCRGEHTLFLELVELADAQPRLGASLAPPGRSTDVACTLAIGGISREPSRTAAQSAYLSVRGARDPGNETIAYGLPVNSLRS